MEVNQHLYFTAVPTEINTLILDRTNCKTLHLAITVCKEWHQIILEMKKYKECKIFHRLTISIPIKNHPYANQLKAVLLGLNMDIMILNRGRFEQTVKHYGKKIFQYEAMFELSPLLFTAVNKFSDHTTLSSAKMMLEEGAHVNIATFSPIQKGFVIDCDLAKHTTALWIAAVKENLELVLCLKSRGGIVFPLLNPLVPLEAKALALLKKADEKLFTAPVRLIEGHESEGSPLCLLSEGLIYRISQIFFRLFH